MTGDRIVVIGAGMGGLVAALELANKGFDVTVVERADAPGGKMREVAVGGARIDAGPTVFTMRWVFDEIFNAAGVSLQDRLTLAPVSTLARHAWSRNQRLDLFADIELSVDAIGRFAGPAEARRYRDFCARARDVYTTLEEPFLKSPKPGPMTLTRSAGVKRMRGIKPFSKLWDVLGSHFHDQRLRQLFGRYATYCGASPFLAPATLMLVAHVEQSGVWLVEGGMHRIARALTDLAEARGARLRFSEEVTGIDVGRGRVSGVRLASGVRLPADVVVVNGDAAALAAGLYGKDVAGAVPGTKPAARSLSAVTWTMLAETAGFPLLRHSVFFSNDYAGEFEDVFRRRRLPQTPTVYVCAQDRDDGDRSVAMGPERLLCLVNAPATGDTRPLTRSEIDACEQRAFGLMRQCGLEVARRPDTTVVTTPTEFDRMFPATGGALYGRASHGWRATFQRPGARSRVPGLYLAGGSVHPGPGVPMAALSGRVAAATVMADLASTSRSRRVAMRGGMSTA